MATGAPVRPLFFSPRFPRWPLAVYADARHSTIIPPDPPGYEQRSSDFQSYRYRSKLAGGIRDMLLAALRTCHFLKASPMLSAIVRSASSNTSRQSCLTMNQTIQAPTQGAHTEQAFTNGVQSPYASRGSARCPLPSPRPLRPLNP